MTERTLRVAAVVVAAAGIAVAAYLLYARETSTALVCSTGGCETVQDSRYAALFGVPVAAIGLVGYSVLLVAAAARGELARLVQATVAVAAVAFSAYLLYVQVAVIGAVCQWCLVSDLLVAALAVLAVLRLRAAA